MAFSKELQQQIREYVYGHLPRDEWYDDNFFPFIDDNSLRERIITEFKNCRVIYKIFEGLQAEEELLLAQIKTQVIMYVSIQEAVINYVLFEKYKDKPEVMSLLYQPRNVKIDIPEPKRLKLANVLQHDGKDILTFYSEIKPVDKTKIRYDQKVTTFYSLNLIDESMKDDLIKLYEYRNTVHIEAEMRKNLLYDLEMGQLAYRRVEGLSIQIKNSMVHK